MSLPIARLRGCPATRSPPEPPITSLEPRRLFARLRGVRGDAREDLLAGPIRGELLGAEHLGERAQVLAGTQQLASRRRARRRTPLLARVTRTRLILEQAQQRLTAAATLGQDLSPAGDWFLDNYHILREHIGEVRESLPRGYYRELPELADGPLAGYPRAYELAITLISHTEGRVDLGNVSGFVSAFQEVAVLNLGELWALPAMFRLGLIENVRRMALRTVQRLDEIESADAAAARIARAGEDSQEALDNELDRFASTPPSLSPTFISRFLQQLRIEGGALPAVTRLEQWIAEEALSGEEATARTTGRLALTQVMMANSITSLRDIGQMDWRTFVEQQSRVETLLRADPSGFYPRMTFATRDRYRHVVERIARRTRLTETAVTRIALECATTGQQAADLDPRQAHVGYYLIDDGLPLLEQRTGYRKRWGEALEHLARRFPSVVFVGGVVSATLLALATLFWLGGPAARQEWLLLILPGLILANDIAVSVINQLVTGFLPPRSLPKLDLREHGVPPEFRTAVVIPTLFGSVEAVREALDNLEVQFLANREAHLHFAVLSDFTDSATETRPDDAAVLEAATDGVRALNARYAPATRDAFYLFHRPRRWNPREGVWMGWERKRGKLAEFNRFVLDGAAGAFTVTVGDLTPIRSVRYVITLDADTALPPDAAPLLVGALAHPLNRAQYDPALGRVVRGYGILQPRVGVSLASAHRSVFAAIHSGHPGVDPYTTAVSDVYQDLYGEGSFTGKGGYDVAAFERATHGRFPENTLLSHDLIEGSFARAGLATDVIVYDDYPSRYLTYTRRKHRWIRGDWQLLPWLTSTRAGTGRPRTQPALAALPLEDLRQPAAQHAGGDPARLPRDRLDSSFPATRSAGPCSASARSPPRGSSRSCSPLLRPPLDRSWRAYYGAVGRDAVTSAQQLGLALVFLAHQAWISVDAIGRTLWRMGVSRRLLLEWQTASLVEGESAGSFGKAWRAMWPAVAVALVVLFLVWWRADDGGAGRAAVAARARGAAAAAGVARLAGRGPRPEPAADAGRTSGSRRTPRARARRYALLHWRYFDRFVSAETHWLAPDNFQAEPEPVVAMRTSPTNIGLQLLATMSAHDLGFLTLEQLLRRLELAFASLAAHAPLPGALLQLVRPPRPERARAGVHLDGGQRQPRRAPHRAPAGLPPRRRRAAARPATLAGARDGDRAGGGAGAGAPRPGGGPAGTSRGRRGARGLAPGAAVGRIAGRGRTVPRARRGAARRGPARGGRAGPRRGVDRMESPAARRAPRAGPPAWERGRR